MSTATLEVAPQAAILSNQEKEFVDHVLNEADLAFTVFRETNTTTANGTVGFVERIPGQEKLISVNYPGPFNRNKPLKALVTGFDGTIYQASGSDRYITKGSNLRYQKLFEQFPDVTTISHVHSPYLGAWAQTHRTLPIRYVPVQRFKLIRELPVYIDRRQPEVDFIIEQLKINPYLPAILEANGGSTAWGWKGLRDLAEFILLLEEGAQIQTRAEAIGGSRDYGPGVLKQQYKMSGLTDTAKQLGLLPITDL